MPCGCESENLLTPAEELRPILPAEGRFLIPVCVTIEEASWMIEALEYARGLSNECDCWDDRRALDLLILGLRKVGSDPTEWDECALAICEEVAECINSNDATRNAIRDLVNGGNQPNNLMTTDERNRDLAGATNSGCDKDILWAQCIGVIERANDFLTSFWAQLEGKSNTIEIGDVIASLPGIELLGADALAEFANIILSAVPENYTIDYLTVDSETGNFWFEDAACELFCMCKLDCKVTLERVFTVFKNRMTANFEALASEWTNVLEWFVDLADLDLSLTNVADIGYYLMFGGLRFANIMLMSNSAGNKVFEVAVKLAAGDPSDDWAAICDDCPDAPACTETFEETYALCPTIAPEITEIDDEGTCLPSGYRVIGDDVFGATPTPANVVIALGADTWVKSVTVDVARFDEAQVWLRVGANPPVPFDMSGINYAGGGAATIHEFEYPVTGAELEIYGRIEEGYGDTNKPMYFLLHHITVEYCDNSFDCEGCETYTEIVANAGQVGTSGVGDDPRITVDDASGWFDTYFLMNPSGGRDEIYFTDVPQCVNRIGVGYSGGSPTGLEQLIAIVNGVEYPMTVVYPLTPVTTPNRQIIYVDIPPQVVETFTIRGAGQNFRIWTVRLFAGCGDEL